MLDADSPRNVLPVCTACGTHYDTHDPTTITSCSICDDPRQYVPAAGQQFTDINELRKNHHNVFEKLDVEGDYWSIRTEPKFAIGQWCILSTQTRVLWDCISLVDEETVNFIMRETKGEGIRCIVISHPHFYTTSALWSTAFSNCPIITAAADAQWLMSRNGSANKLQREEKAWIETEDYLPESGPQIKIAGGHFPGSLLYFEGDIAFVSDTIMIVPSSKNPHEHRIAGATHSCAFMWSIPNMIPLPPKDIMRICGLLQTYEKRLGRPLRAMFGNIPGLQIIVDPKREREESIVRRVIDSAKTQIKAMGWEGRPEVEEFMKEEE